MEELPSGGYIACGSSGSNAWLLKVDENSNEQSSWYYSGFTYVENFDQTADGGFIVIGSGPENEGDLNDILVVKVNSDGIEEWRGYYGYGSTLSEQLGKSIHQLSDGSYIVAGTIYLGNLQYYLTKI